MGKKASIAEGRRYSTNSHHIWLRYEEAGNTTVFLIIFSIFDQDLQQINVT